VGPFFRVGQDGNPRVTLELQLPPQVAPTASAGLEKAKKKKEKPNKTPFEGNAHSISPFLLHPSFNNKKKTNPK
jgi:hypothetical protein